MLTLEQKQKLIEENRVHDTDTGSPEVQIAILTARINYLTERSSFPSRPVEIGWPASRFVGLPASQRYRTLS